MLLADYDQYNHTPIKNWASGVHLCITELGTRELNETGLNKIILKKKGQKFLLLIASFYFLIIVWTINYTLSLDTWH